MSQENVDFVRRLYAAWGGDAFQVDDESWELLDPEVEWDVSRRILDPAIYHGHAGVKQFTASLREVWESAHIVPLEFIPADDEVVVPVRLEMVSRTDKQTVTANAAHVWTVRSGKVVRHCVFQTKAEALEAVGLSESARSQESVEIVRKMVAAWNAGDMDGLLELCAPGIEVVFPPNVPEPGPFRGRDELRAWAEGFMAAWADFQAEIQQAAQAGERVVVALHLRGHGRDTGIEIEQTDWHVFTIREGDGKITDWRNYETQAEALEAVGLSGRAG